MIGNCLARLEIDLNAVALAEIDQQADQPVDLVAGAGDVMPPAKIYPLHTWNEFAEALLEGLDGARQRRQILLAQGVKMQPAHTIEGHLPELCASDAQPGAGCAGIVERDRAFGMLRVDA